MSPLALIVAVILGWSLGWLSENHRFSLASGWLSPRHSLLPYSG